MFWNLTRFGEAWKICPIHKKKGRRQEISNYRPISVLATFSKILATLVQERVVTFLNKHMIFVAQNGFKEDTSTIAATQTFIGDIQKALHNKLLVVGMVLDLSNAFVTLNHKLLLAKLELCVL
jgi:hypothetical protein